MGNNNKFTELSQLQGPGGRGRFADALNGTLGDGRGADIVYTALQETRLNLTEWVSGYSAQSQGAPLDMVLFQNARREGARNTKSRVRGWVEGAAAKYSGNLKSMIAFSSGRFIEDPSASLFGRLTEVCIGGVPVPNPKKAFIGKSVLEQTNGGAEGLRCCFVGAHFPVAKLAAALEDSAIDQLHGAKVALARSLRKILRRASSSGIADGRTIIFVSGDLNSRTVLRPEELSSEYSVTLNGSGGLFLGMEFNDTGPSAYTNTGYLIVTAIVRGGLVEAWNRSHQPMDQIRIGDCVVEVNGIRDDLQKLQEECKVAKRWSFRLHRKVADVMLEVLRDDDMQAAIQHELGLPPGRWHEIAEYDTVYDLPVTYKFLDHVACTPPDISPTRRQGGGSSVLTISDIMSVDFGRTSATQDDEPSSPVNTINSRRRLDEAAFVPSTRATATSSVEIYRRQMTRVGDDRLATYGLAYKKHDFRAFRFPASADRIIFWASDRLSDRISFEFPRGGYEVNHSQLGSDHRPVTLEVVMRLAPEGKPVRTSKILRHSIEEQQRMSLLFAQSDDNMDQEGRESDDEHSAPDVSGVAVVSEAFGSEDVPERTCTEDSFEASQRNSRSSPDLSRFNRDLASGAAAARASKIAAAAGGPAARGPGADGGADLNGGAGGREGGGGALAPPDRPKSAVEGKASPKSPSRVSAMSSSPKAGGLRSSHVSAAPSTPKAASPKGPPGRPPGAAARLAAAAGTGPGAGAVGVGGKAKAAAPAEVAKGRGAPPPKH